MRYYDIRISDPNSGETVKHWSAIDKNGKPAPGALRVQMDMFVVAGQAYNGESSLSIYGVALDDLYNANNLYGKHIEVRGGFTSGLPLENPDQAGVLFSGYIFQSVGNWVGTDMSISLMLKPTVHSQDNPGNYVLNWHKGQHLKEALINTFETALPKMPHNINISDTLVAESHRVKKAPTLASLAEQIYSETRQYYKNRGHNSEGVQIGVRQGVIEAWDTTKQGPTIQLNAEDLIGQPTWFDKKKMEFMTPMRADIAFGDLVEMPSSETDLPGFAQTHTRAMPKQIHYKKLFPGKFRVTQVRQIGDNRSPEGKEWASVFVAIAEG